MFQNLEIMRLAQGMAGHAAARQGVIARNIANADTPEYRARDIASFAETFRGETDGAMRATRAGHIGGAGEMSRALTPVDAGGPSAPNGNTVSLEGEMVKSVEVKKEHDLALAVYRSSLDVLRTSIGRR